MPPSRKSVQNRKRRQERIRQEKHLRKQVAAEERATPLLHGAFDAERRLRVLARLKAHLAEADLPPLSELVSGKSLQELWEMLPPDAVEEAQDVAFQAMEADSYGEALDLAEEALELDPTCLDALCLKASLESQDLAGAAEALARVVAAEEARRGEAYYQEREGHFWEEVTTRPYMRALAGLAQMQEEVGRFGDAIRHLQRLLRLDPQDAQGGRNVLVRTYLASGDLKGLRVFLKECMKEEVSPVFAWAEVLERFKAGALAGAQAALAKARKSNPHVEDFLTGKRRLPHSLPASYESGSPEEAVMALDFIGLAWTEDRQAMAWLLRGGKAAGEPQEG